MCGFIAFVTSDPVPDAAINASLLRLARRGPDAEGRWQEEGVVFGHRRLAILDLDARSSQPMTSRCGRYVIAFNGEIYNFRALRRELEQGGSVFRTDSDTEVLLELYVRTGARMLRRLQGMFAFVIWDTIRREAFAARDPYGIKPLYVGASSRGVVLSSQVKAIVATGLVDTAPDPIGQAGFWMLGSVPEPYTWFRNIRSIPSGNWVLIQDGKVREQRIWHDIGSAWREAETTPINASEANVRSIVRAALNDSVDRHLESDVPIGVFLSGGIDSGTLAGLMLERGARELLGVTICYSEFEGMHEDETNAAAQIARHYGIRHHVRLVTKEEFLADLPRILSAMDQPTIDGVNTWYASKAIAEQGLKVVVSGVGGDELFLGYDSFRHLPRLLALQGVVDAIPGLPMLAEVACRIQARRSGNDRWRNTLKWLRQGPGGAWWLRRSVHTPEAVLFLGDQALSRSGKKSSLARTSELMEALSDFTPKKWMECIAGDLAAQPELALGQIESTAYLRNQLLRDSDWASMDHSVELRTPLVDSYLLEQLRPLLQQFPRFSGKSLLALAPARPLPAAILRRRKTGFGIPIRQWHRSIVGPGESWQQTVAKYASQ
jgi:asparagine synthase (glutamine-hydrolysing)